MKKFLKTPEEVIDALHEGKKVFGCGETYRLYKGILVGKLEDGTYIINRSIFKQENPYIEEPEPFKIEVGKFYKTRGGKKARCFFIDKDSARCTIDGCFEWFEVYLKTGWACVAKSDYNIIGPWKE